MMMVVGLYSYDTPSQNNMSQVSTASPLTHCSAMMVSQLQTTTSEHALYVGRGSPCEGDSEFAGTDQWGGTMMSSQFDSSHDLRTIFDGGQLSNNNHESFTFTD